jgi:hypothetical protein
MTIGDRIRRMKNDELVDTLIQVIRYTFGNKPWCICRTCSSRGKCTNCRQCMLEWLESPCEDPDTDLDKQ